MSPLTVPTTTFPIDSAPVSASNGRRMFIPAFIAFAARSTSGTNKIPSRKSTPTMRIPSTSASCNTLSGPQPRSNKMVVPSTISSPRPSYKSSCICATRSSLERLARSMSSKSLICTPVTEWSRDISRRGKGYQGGLTATYSSVVFNDDGRNRPLQGPTESSPE